MTRGFVRFVREQGIVGLAIGFILGGAIQKVVSALVQDIINPIAGIALKSLPNLKDASFNLGSAKIMWGDFVSVLIDFLILASVVYFIIKGLGFDKLDKNKETKNAVK